MTRNNAAREDDFLDVYNAYDAWVRGRISASRYQHTLGVVKAARKLASTYRCDMEKASVAALCHDAAKGMSKDALLLKAEEGHWPLDWVERMRPDLLHGPVAAILCYEELGIKDEDILNAIRYHTTGRPDMSLLEQIVYLADLIEEGRDFPEVSRLRTLADQNLTETLTEAFDHILRFILESGDLIHPTTIHARNWYRTKLILNKEEESMIGQQTNSYFSGQGY
jgi:predicted HD superfamily hydrolase involved in NAD metabolism